MNYPLAHVHPQAKIDSSVIIGPFTSISKNVKIGAGTWIGSNVTIMDGARIGKNVKIFPGAVISSIPQDLKFDGSETTAEIGDHTTVREYVTVNRGTKANKRTVVGSHSLLMAYVHIAHDCIVGNHCILANAVNLAGHVSIDDYAILGGLSAVHQFVHIGSHVMISGGSLVRKDVPPFTKAARDPLSFVGINSLGLRRRGYLDEKINEIREIYRMIFNKNMNVSQAIAFIEAEMPATAERDEILRFITGSSRGIMKGYNPQK